MVQVKGKNSKKRETSPKTKPTNNAKDVESVKVVNDKNEIIYDGEQELKKIMDKLPSSNMKEILPDLAKEAMDEVKKASKVAETLDINNTDVAKIDIEKALEDLSLMEKKLEKDINERSSLLNNKPKKNVSRFDFTTFWSGISDGWTN